MNEREMLLETIIKAQAELDACYHDDPFTPTPDRVFTGRPILAKKLKDAKEDLFKFDCRMAKV